MSTGILFAVQVKTRVATGHVEHEKWSIIFHFFPFFFFLQRNILLRGTHTCSSIYHHLRVDVCIRLDCTSSSNLVHFFLFFRSDSNFDLFTTQRCTCKIDGDWLPPREIDTYLSSPSQPLLVIETGTKQSTKCPGTLLFFSRLHPKCVSVKDFLSFP